jgi:type II secretion system protein H
MTDRQTSTRRPNGFTLTELLMVIVILGILAALATPRVYQTVARAKVKQAAGVLAADLEQAVALAGRTRKPVVVAKEAATTYTIRDRVASGTGTLRLQRVIALTGDQGVTTMTFSRTPLQIFPNGTTDGAFTVTVTGAGITRTVTVSVAGQVRVT